MSKKLTITVFFLLFSFVLAPTRSLAVLNDFGASEIFSEDSAKILTKEAKVIIKGEVKSVNLSKGINDVAYVRASVSVSETIKGKVAKKNIVVEYKKNEADSADDFEFSEKENASSLKQGEEVILFLTNSFWRKNVYYLVGGFSGKYAICADDTVIVGSSCDEEKQNNDNVSAGDENKDETATSSAYAKKETLGELLSEIKIAE